MTSPEALPPKFEHKINTKFLTFTNRGTETIPDRSPDCSSATWCRTCSLVHSPSEISKQIRVAFCYNLETFLVRTVGDMNSMNILQ